MELGADDAMGIDDEASSRVGMVGVFTTAVDANDPCLIFNGAGLEESDPVVDSFDGPIGNDGKYIRSRCDAFSKEFGKSEIVTDGRANIDAITIVDMYLLASLKN